MASNEASFLGLAKQTALGTPNVTDAQYKYLLFTESGLSVNNMFRPLDREVGGGALNRGVVKVGVNSGGAVGFIPRPEVLGDMLHGLVGGVASVQEAATAAYTHTFELPADEFDAPYFTVRSAPANLWGEQFQDMRVTGLSLDWRGADYVRGSVGFLGGLPAKVSTASWSASTYVDGGAQFLAPISTIELPTGTNAKVLAGQFIGSSGIPLEEQYIVGSYVPDGFDIQNRSFSLSLLLKVADDTLYTKMAYDPAAGSAWTADIFREADINIELLSDQLADVGYPFKIAINANGQSAASGNANVVWSVQPLAIGAGRQLTMRVTGTVLAYSAAAPISIALTNTTTSY